MAMRERWRRRARTSETAGTAPGTDPGTVAVVEPEAPEAAPSPGPATSTSTPAGRTAPDPAPPAAGRDTPGDSPAASPTDSPATAPARQRRGLGDLEPVLLLRASHPRQALVTALGIAACAALSGREAREVGVVLATVLVGQAILGWHNDLVDRGRDARHDLPGKPVAQQRLEPASVWFAIACAVLLLVPLAVATGITAGSCYLVSVAIGLLGNVALRRGLLSWVPWAASYALYAPYLSYGGWGGQFEGAPPEVAMVALFALLGIGVHVLRALWGLVPDNKDGWTYLPLRLGRRLGAGRLLTVTTVYLALVLVGMAFVGTSVGLRQ